MTGISQVRHLINLGVLLLIAGCTLPTQWKLDGISAGDAAYESTRLRFLPPLNQTPLTFELLKSKDEILAYLNLYQFTWSFEAAVPVVFQIGEERVEASLPLLEGRMRLKIPPEIVDKITNGLQNRQKVGILADGFEVTLESDQFARYFNRFLGKQALFQNIFKGPIE